MNTDQIDVCRKALIKFGKEQQTNICIEELAELTDAICKHRRGRNNFQDVCSEIADVIICATQMSMVYGEKEVEKQIAYKIDRLNKRIEE